MKPAFGSFSRLREKAGMRAGSRAPALTPTLSRKREREPGRGAVRSGLVIEDSRPGSCIQALP